MQNNPVRPVADNVHNNLDVDFEVGPHAGGDAEPAGEEPRRMEEKAEDMVEEDQFQYQFLSPPSLQK